MHAVDPATLHRVRPPVDAARLRHARRQRRSPRSATPATARTRAARCRSAPRRRCSTTRAIPTVLCGPGHIAQAHQPNEWVSARRSSRAAKRSCGASPIASAWHEPPRSAEPDDARCVRGAARRSTSTFPDHRAAGRRATAGIPYVWRFAAERAGPARHDPGADARQRGVRRHRARLAARARRAAAARHADARLRQRRRVRSVRCRPIRSRRAASTRTSTGCGPPTCSTARATRASSRAPARCGRSTTRPTTCSTCTR